MVMVQLVGPNSWDQTRGTNSWDQLVGLTGGTTIGSHEFLKNLVNLAKNSWDHEN